MDRIMIQSTRFTEAKLLTLVAHDDHRGWFEETWSHAKYEDMEITDTFAQTSVSYSTRNTLRGLHGDAQMSKLVSCIRGRIYDVIVDARKDSGTYLQWQGFYLTGENRKQIFVPAGFAHGFFALTDAIVSYGQSREHNPQTEFQIRWNDPAISIVWPGNPRYPLVSEKDANAPLLACSDTAGAA
jgi:dTDP-4-dehydrorhamnose 3,5-epimerase